MPIRAIPVPSLTSPANLLNKPSSRSNAPTAIKPLTILSTSISPNLETELANIRIAAPINISDPAPLTILPSRFDKYLATKTTMVNNALTPRRPIPSCLISSFDKANTAPANIPIAPAIAIIATDVFSMSDVANTFCLNAPKNLPKNPPPFSVDKADELLSPLIFFITSSIKYTRALIAATDVRSLVVSIVDITNIDAANIPMAAAILMMELSSFSSPEPLKASIIEDMLSLIVPTMPFLGSIVGARALILLIKLVKAMINTPNIPPLMMF